MADIYHLRDWRVGIIQQTGVGSFVDTSLVSTASVQIPTNLDAEIKRNVVKRHPNRTNQRRHKNLIDHTQDDKNVAPTFVWSSHATREHLDYLLSGLFQRVDEEALTPFSKQFKWPASTAVWSATTFGYPAFSDDEGYYYGFVLENPVASAFDEGIISCVPTSASFSIDSTSEDSRLQFNSNWMGRLAQDTVAFTAPTPYTAITGFNFQDMTVTIGGTAVVCYGWNINITPGFKQIPGRGASCQNISMGDGMHIVTGYVDILWDTSARAIFNDLGDNAGGYQDQVFKAYWGTGSHTTNGDLEFELTCQFDNVSNQGTEERIYRLSFECAEDVGSTDPIVVYLANAIDRVWQS